MWIIKKDEQKAQEYLKLLMRHAKMQFFEKTGLKKNVKKELHSCKAYEYLDKKKIEEYITASPERLLEMHDELYNKIEIHEKEKEEKCIKAIMNYNNLIAQNKDMSYKLAKLMNVNTCIYCNRQYTLTVDENDHGLIRPEFDHWFPQKEFPDLALSYFNLIPVCHFCNSSLKRDKNIKFEEYIHPYRDTDIGFHFSYVLNANGYSVITEKNENVKDIYFNKVQNTLDLFKIQQIYNAHSELELKDILELAMANPPDYIDVLITEVASKLGIYENEAYRLLFGIEVDEDRYAKRPMSKFKNDIIKEIRNKQRK